MRYGLRSVALDKYDGTSWINVAAANGSAAVNARLFGSWSATAAAGGGGPAQNKLSLWSKSGLDQFRNTGVDWGIRFGKRFPGYPCFPPPEPSRVCLDFQKLKIDSAFPSPFQHPDNDGVTISIGKARRRRKAQQLRRAASSSHTLRKPIDGWTQMLCPAAVDGIRIDFAKPANAIRIVAVGDGADPINAYAVDVNGAQSGPFLSANGSIEIRAADVMSVTLMYGRRVCLVKICALLAPSGQTVAFYQDMAAHNQNATALWSGVGNVLDPYTQYRLRFETSSRPPTIHTTQLTIRPSININMHIFKPAALPASGSSRFPVNATAQNFDSGLDDLARYVEQTVPPQFQRPAETAIAAARLPRIRRGRVFNEDYVEFDVPLAGRDLNLLL